MVYEKNNLYELRLGKMQDELQTLDDNSIDSIVTDPPYELNFMGKGWDNTGVAFQKETWEQCFRVLKSGGYLLAFGGSRTFHRIACAIEDAGFEIKDTIMWLYGSGFPKSFNIGKQIEAKVLFNDASGRSQKYLKGEKVEANMWTHHWSYENGAEKNDYSKLATEKVIDVEYTTELGKKWQGWGTQLKPAYEPIIVARKPVKGSIIDNVIEYGVGGINIDECRVEYGNESDTRIGTDAVNSSKCGFWQKEGNNGTTQMYKDNGRFPANVILTYDDTDFDEVCGGFPDTKSNGGKTTMQDFRDVGKKSKETIGVDKLSFGQINNAKRKDSSYIAPCDSGSASRYFYCAKASNKDREEGLESFEYKVSGGMNGTKDQSLLTGSGNVRNNLRKNIHPTVKPTELMQYLVRLVTPKGGIVLDPFMGSGSTGKATMIENSERQANYKFIGVEMTQEYLPICHARIEFGVNYKEKLIEKENSLKVDESQITFESLGAF